MAFSQCITSLDQLFLDSLEDMPLEAKKFHAEAMKFRVFLKVFYEGGFCYNWKKPIGQTGFVPLNKGTAAIDLAPAFEGQSGIQTGYPYKLPAPFLPFTEAVPITIKGISKMSDLHGRYGLCFTRAVYIWQGPDFEMTKELNCCSILPYGGFFYVPENFKDWRQKGGYVYAFQGPETKEDSTPAEEIEAD